jgi:hypothetical protein
VSISKGQQKVFWGSLLPRGYGRPDSGEYEVEITRELIALFDRGVTQVDWEQRRKLRRKPLAQWLHIDYAGHAKPFPVSISFLHEKAGSTTKSLRKFKQLVKAALNEIEGLVQSKMAYRRDRQSPHNPNPVAIATAFPRAS